MNAIRETSMPQTRDATGELIAEWSGTAKGVTRGLRGRRLSPGEKTILEIFFGGKLNADKVRMHANHMPGAWAMCLDNHIFFSKSMYRSDFAAATADVSGLALLVHECCHVWQYQRKIRNYRWYKALVEQLQFGSKVYDYGIDEHDCLVDFRFEQQGAILQDYAGWYLGLGGHPAGPLAARFRHVIGCALPMKEPAEGQTLRRGRFPATKRVLARY